MKHFIIHVAGLDVEVSHIFNKVRQYCEPYIVKDAVPAFRVCAEGPVYEEECAVFGPEEAESLAICRAISEQLPFFDAFCFHAAAVSYKNSAYLFSAPHGTGKTTHIMHWKNNLSGVEVVNGDKPFVFKKNSEWFVCGTPWCGKERMNVNSEVKIKALCVLKRADTNKIRKVSASDNLAGIMNGLYIPLDSVSYSKELDLLDDFLKKIPLYELDCTSDVQSFVVSYECLTGERL